MERTYLNAWIFYLICFFHLKIKCNAHSIIANKNHTRTTHIYWTSRCRGSVFSYFVSLNRIHAYHLRMICFHAYDYVDIMLYVLELWRKHIKGMSTYGPRHTLLLYATTAAPAAREVFKNSSVNIDSILPPKIETIQLICLDICMEKSKMVSHQEQIKASTFFRNFKTPTANAIFTQFRHNMLVLCNRIISVFVDWNQTAYFVNLR